MAKFYTILPDEGIVVTLSQQLSWSHHIGEYWLKLPPKELLQAKLHKAMIEARTRLELRRKGDGNA